MIQEPYQSPSLVDAAPAAPAIESLPLDKTPEQEFIARTGLAAVDHRLDAGAANEVMLGDPETLALKNAVISIVETYLNTLNTLTSSVAQTLEANVAHPTAVSGSVRDLMAIMTTAAEQAGHLDQSRIIIARAALVELRNMLAPQRVAAFMMTDSIRVADRSHTSAAKTLRKLIDLEDGASRTGEAEVPAAVLSAIRALAQSMDVPEFSMTVVRQRAQTFDHDCQQQLEVLAEIEKAAVVLENPAVASNLELALSNLKDHLATLANNQEYHAPAAAELIASFKAALAKMINVLQPLLASVKGAE